MTVIFVTHDINAATAYAGRIIALRSGRVVFDGLPSALISNHELAEIYARNFRLVIDPAREVPLVVTEQIY